jgi:hypothetical protein
VQFNLTFDPSVNSAPAAFKTTVEAVANFYASQLTDNVTVNLNIGYGEVGGSALPSGALGASSTNLVSTSYGALVKALKADAIGAADHSAVASLPTRDPTGFGFYWVSTAEGKALGLYSGTGVDGSIGFSSTASFDYTTTNSPTETVAPGAYDFFGTVAHEFSEVMGRLMLDGGRISFFSHSFTPLDLFHFSAAHTRTFSGSKAGYFSADNGATNLEAFNTNPAGDYGDWSSAGGVDAFNAFATAGKPALVSSADVTALDVIGWNAAAATGSTTTAGSVTSVQLPAGMGETHVAAGHGDVDAAIRMAMSGVGQGLFNTVHATDLDYYFAA